MNHSKKKYHFYLTFAPVITTKPRWYKNHGVKAFSQKYESYNGNSYHSISLILFISYAGLTSWKKKELLLVQGE